MSEPRGTKTRSRRTIRLNEQAKRRQRRRPSGEPPPLPHPIQSTGKLLLLELGLLFVFLAIIALTGIGLRLDRWENNFLHDLASIRNDFFTSVAKWIDTVLSGWAITILRWGALIALLALRRFRHFFVFLGSVLLVGWLTTIISTTFNRPRPVGVEILTDWQGPSVPSRPAAALAVTLFGIAYSFVPAGRPRTIAKRTIQITMLAYFATRIYLGVDHPLDFVAAGIIGVSIPVLAFRILAPNDSFPVTYGGGRSAHLEITPERAAAIRRAIEEQLGIEIDEIEPFGLAGSGGSTPLRLKTPGGDHLFAKLYANTHLRADRWYKLGRTLLYGRLEDEASFSTVRRLVQYEDYMLRVMRDAGLPTPLPYGFAEITPEREYVIVTEFVGGGKELLDEPELDDDILDSSLMAVRMMWDAGIAHRDVKPSNILVRDGKIYLIDVAFGQVRPSPWRQAVDLANMMLVLGLRRGPDVVYERALRYFTPDDIAEAFAATHTVTMPSQSRSMLRKNRGSLFVRLVGRRREREDLLAAFRALAPKRPVIRIQRWSWRRIGLTASVLLSVFLIVSLAIGNLQGAGLLGPQGDEVTLNPLAGPPECDRDDGDQVVLMVQSVPTAQLIPCLQTLPSGWTFGGLGMRAGRSEMFLDSDRAGVRAVSVVLVRRCNVDGATEVPSDEPGTRRYERVRLTSTGYTGSRFYIFDGGCVEYRFSLRGAAGTRLTEEVSVALGFRTRAGIARGFDRDTGLHL